MFVESIVGEGSLIKRNMKREEKVKEIIDNYTYIYIINDLFTEQNYHNFQDILEKLFFEEIRGSFSKKLSVNIKENKITKNEFINEFFKSGEEGLFGVMVGLELL